MSYLYRASLGGFLILFIACCSLLPIDTLIQSTKNSQGSANLAVNAIIVIICCVLFIVVSGVFTTYRFIQFYKILGEIPRNYVPIHSHDFTSPQYYSHVTANTRRCQKIYKESCTPKVAVEHPGLSSPVADHVVPSSLVYEDVVRSVAERIRLSRPKSRGLCLREIFDSPEAAGMVAVYEKLRFSGRPIEQGEFLRFLAEILAIYR